MTIHAFFPASWQAFAPYASKTAGSYVLSVSVSEYNGSSWVTLAEILSAVAVTGSTTVANGVNLNLGTSVTGGYGALTYLWTKTSGTGTISGSATNSTVTILAGANNSEGNYRITVTDSLTGTVVFQDFLATWGTPP